MMKRIFSLDKMITPSIIRIIYWLVLAMSVTYGLLIMIITIAEGLGVLGVFAGLFIIVVSPIFVRVVCELLQVPFKILEELKTLNAKE